FLSFHPPSTPHTSSLSLHDALPICAAWGYTVETATTAIRMVLSGVFEKHPKLKVVLGHLGETLPFLVWRVDHAIARPGAAKSIRDRKSTRLNSSHLVISYAVFCLKK